MMVSVQDGSTVAAVNLYEVINDNVSIGSILFPF